MSESSVPYHSAKSGGAARDDIHKILQRFGANRVGFMDNFEDHSVLLAFSYKEKNIEMRASAKGWATLYLMENPWNKRRRGTKIQYENRALNQGLIAVNSILRDWIKGQITAVECGLMSFDHVFFPNMLLPDGRIVMDVIKPDDLLKISGQSRKDQ